MNLVKLLLIWIPRVKFCDHFNMMGGGERISKSQAPVFFLQCFLGILLYFDKSTRNESELSLT